jgi:N-acetylmuramoyl-L-alanine amidase
MICACWTLIVISAANLCIVLSKSVKSSNGRPTASQKTIRGEARALEGGNMGKIGIVLVAASLLTGCATSHIARTATAPRLTASVRSWRELERHHHTVTRAEFEALIRNRYAPSGALASYLSISDDSVCVFATPEKSKKLWSLKFANPASGLRQLTPVTGGRVQRLPRPDDAPLRDLAIALDPGHIGGEWARMEERFFFAALKEGEKPLPPIQEAAANLIVARLLKERLEQLGATVLMVKDNLQPVTKKRPEDFRAQAARDVDRQLRGNAEFEAMHPILQQAHRADLVRQRMELLFYRNDEIQARAELVNQWKPDVTLCIHFDAKGWTSEKDKLTEDNRLVVFVHGNYLPSELESEDGKLGLFAKLLEGSAEIELKLADSISRALAQSTGLPPPNKHPPGGSSGWLLLGENPYVYARNLLANRLFQGPVIFLEPYYQNNPVVYQRILAGDYEGEREIAGQKFRSIFRDYANGVVAGLLEYYAPTKKTP